MIPGPNWTQVKIVSGSCLVVSHWRWKKSDESAPLAQPSTPPNGWMSVPGGVERYTDAMYRHLMKEAQGELIDPDSGTFHAAQAAWNALARLDMMLRKWGQAS